MGSVLGTRQIMSRFDFGDGLILRIARSSLIIGSACYQVGTITNKLQSKTVT